MSERSERARLVARGATRRSWPLIVLLLVAACTGGDDTTAPSPTIATSTTATTTTTAPPTTPTTASPLTPIEGCPDPGPLADPDPARPRYTATVTADPGTGSVTGSVTVHFTPDLPTDQLVFRLWPNAPVPAASGVSMTLGTTTPYPATQPDPTTAVIPLPAPLHAGDAVDVTLPFEIAIPATNTDRVARPGDALRLGSFLPLLAWEPGVGWATEPPTTVFAEAATSTTADYDVTITTPPGYQVLATGQDDGTGRWHATAVRDFAATIGHFTFSTGTTSTGVAVTVGVDEGVALEADPAAYRDRVIEAFDAYTARFGAYPWPTFSLSITADLRGGIEFPTHVMQGPDTLGRTTVHEVAHQWFYSLIGDDQARDPWLDEGLASYVEFTHAGTLAARQDDAIPPDAQGAAGEPMTYWEGHAGSYYRGVYVQPAVALASLGTTAQIDCALRQYVAANAFTIVTPAALFAALGTVFPDAATALAPYGLHP